MENQKKLFIIAELAYENQRKTLTLSSLLVMENILDIEIGFKIVN